VLRLDRIAGGFYWLLMSGRELKQGATLADAEPLQPSFAERMREIGRGEAPPPSIGKPIKRRRKPGPREI
jgi:hypothetical protein